MATILIVDDTEANILVFRELLAKDDRSFLTATNGNDALKIALNQDIDLILLDVQMPGMDGFEVAQILKSNKRTKDIPILFASAVKKEQQFIMKAFEEGAVDYLFKPLDPEVTEAKVSVFLKLQAQKKELEKKNLSLEKANVQIDSLNMELLENVRKLQDLNADMESFSYSVSHDLKAPLRSVLSYSEILAEDHADQLNEEARQLIGKISAGGQRMQRLIDDLLDFSKMGRKELVRGEVDMEALARKVVQDLKDVTPAKARIEVCALSQVPGDKSLLEQVWANLIGNAIKYSSKKESPHIVVQEKEESGAVIFSVKDNGAGFNMKYAEKLFGVFQRLHSNRDFEGTGIGLATVQRILRKHGGKIWAEAKEGEGATFFFSLPV